MGDRHNIGLVQYDYNDAEPRDILWIYSHWGFYTENSEKFSEVVAEALHNSRERWDDHSYFNRMFIHSLGTSVSGLNLGKATGDEHKRYVVDSQMRTVSLMDNYHWLGELKNMPEPIVTFSFENFVQKYAPSGLGVPAHS